jgi:hypothetical protein
MTTLIALLFVAQFVSIFFLFNRYTTLKVTVDELERLAENFQEEIALGRSREMAEINNLIGQMYLEEEERDNQNNQNLAQN